MFALEAGKSIRSNSRQMSIKLFTIPYTRVPAAEEYDHWPVINGII